MANIVLQSVEFYGQWDAAGRNPGVIGSVNRAIAGVAPTLPAAEAVTAVLGAATSNMTVKVKPVGAAAFVKVQKADGAVEPTIANSLYLSDGESALVRVAIGESVYANTAVLA